MWPTCDVWTNEAGEIWVDTFTIAATELEILCMLHDGPLSEDSLAQSKLDGN